jgi:hypothetical protein
MSDDRVKSVEAEVQKLFDARIIREVQYPVWVANVVMVPKKNGNMCMCIDFTELNKACPKDPYPLPRIDVIIDQAAGCEMLSLLDFSPGITRCGCEGRTRPKRVSQPPSEFSQPPSGCQRTFVMLGPLSTV